MANQDIETLLHDLQDKLTTFRTRCVDLNDSSGRAERWGDIEAYMTESTEIRQVPADLQGVISLIQRIRAAVRNSTGHVRGQGVEEESAEESEDEEMEDAQDMRDSLGDADGEEEDTSAPDSEVDDDVRLNQKKAHREVGAPTAQDIAALTALADLVGRRALLPPLSEAVNSRIAKANKVGRDAVRDDRQTGSGSALPQQGNTEPGGTGAGQAIDLPRVNALVEDSNPIQTATATEAADQESDERSVDSNATLTAEDLIEHLSELAVDLEPIIERSWEFVAREGLTYEDLRTGLRTTVRRLRGMADVLGGMIARMEVSEDGGT